MRALITKVFQWGIDRDLYKYSSIPTQLVKLVEEFFEYEDAKEKIQYFGGNIEELRSQLEDAKGDMLVVALNMFGANEFKQNGEATADELADRFYNCSLSHNPELLANKGIKKIIEDSVKLIIRNKMNPQTLCYSLICYYGSEAYPLLLGAYDEIKDRKGKLTPDGNFVKEEDL